MDTKDLEQEVLQGIKKCWSENENPHFLTLIKFAHDKALFSADIFEYFFIQSLDYVIKNKLDILPQNIDNFGLSVYRCADLIEQYISHRFDNNGTLLPHALLVIDFGLENAIKNGIPFSDSFLNNESIKINVSEERYEYLLQKNKENTIYHFNFHLSDKLENKEFESKNVEKI